MENPGRRLSFADCQGLVAGNELYDLSRIVRFLDHWGIINYLSSSSVHRGLRMAGSLLREDANDSAARLGDLDVRIRESLCEHSCSYCSRPLPSLLYQSQKEAETILCTDCFNDAKFITGHSSLDFVRMDSKKDLIDSDVDSWTDQETLLLLEAIEKFKDNWNEIAEHVGTKSKAQCILHFIRLPMEDGLLENIEVPRVDVPAVSLELQNKGLSSPNSKGNSANSEDISGDQLPFASSANPVMSMVAFLASAIGPRVAAACASAALTVLTKEDPRLSSENMHVEFGNQGTTYPNSGRSKDGSLEENAANARKESSPLLSDHVRYAAECGLSAAATKAKLFADQEEREVQRLAANIINHQLKRLELKLKQFAEVETLLLKECEQVGENKAKAFSRAWPDVICAPCTSRPRHPSHTRSYICKYFNIINWKRCKP
ncbi:hypothetical protein HPP92_009064 [Vanilla planifolia]|uniref:SWI/SNF complex subunit SWI3C n=1 Tax=Vanilla planifolia TaxID=51239 RepID=A0A835V4C6_VANPL|nr:hypothetical protein HPP92_009064 [Vanilla planifolia]